MYVYLFLSVYRKAINERIAWPWSNRSWIRLRDREYIEQDGCRIEPQPWKRKTAPETQRMIVVSGCRANTVRRLRRTGKNVSVSSLMEGGRDLSRSATSKSAVPVVGWTQSVLGRNQPRRLVVRDGCGPSWNVTKKKNNTDPGYQFRMKCGCSWDEAGSRS